MEAEVVSPRAPHAAGVDFTGDRTVPCDCAECQFFEAWPSSNPGAGSSRGYRRRPRRAIATLAPAAHDAPTLPIPEAIVICPLCGDGPLASDKYCAPCCETEICKACVAATAKKGEPACPLCGTLIRFEPRAPSLERGAPS